MNNLEQRIYRLEQDANKLKEQMTDVLRRLARLEQQQWSNGGSGGGGGGSSAGYFGCTLSSTLAHGGHLDNQTVWQLGSGSHSNVSTTATVYHDGPTAASDITSALTQVILAANGDGTYTVVSVYCA